MVHKAPYLRALGGNMFNLRTSFDPSQSPRLLFHGLRDELLVPMFLNFSKKRP